MMSHNPTDEPEMNVCTYSEFLVVLKQLTRHLPREFVLLATQDLESRIAFFVYVLLLDVALRPEVQTHTICIGQRKIADYLNVSQKTIKRAMKFLKKKGYLKIVNMPPAKGGYQSNQIQVLFPEALIQTLLKNDKPVGLSLSTLKPCDNLQGEYD